MNGWDRCNIERGCSVNGKKFTSQWSHTHETSDFIRFYQDAKVNINDLRMHLSLLCILVYTVRSPYNFFAKVKQTNKLLVQVIVKLKCHRKLWS